MSPRAEGYSEVDELDPVNASMSPPRSASWQSGAGEGGEVGFFGEQEAGATKPQRMVREGATEEAFLVAHDWKGEKVVVEAGLGAVGVLGNYVRRCGLNTRTSQDQAIHFAALASGSNRQPYADHCALCDFWVGAVAAGGGVPGARKWLARRTEGWRAGPVGWSEPLRRDGGVGRLVNGEVRSGP